MLFLGSVDTFDARKAMWHSLFSMPGLGKKFGAFVIDTDGEMCNEINRLASEFGKFSDIVVCSPKNPDFRHDFLSQRFSPHHISHRALAMKIDESPAGLDPFWSHAAENMLSHLISIYRYVENHFIASKSCHGAIPPLSWQVIDDMVRVAKSLWQEELSTKHKVGFGNPSIPASNGIEYLVMQYRELLKTIPPDESAKEHLHYFENSLSATNPRMRLSVCKSVIRLLTPFQTKDFSVLTNTTHLTDFPAAIAMGRIFYIPLCDFQDRTSALAFARGLKIDVFSDLFDSAKNSPVDKHTPLIYCCGDEAAMIYSSLTAADESTIIKLGVQINCVPIFIIESVATFCEKVYSSVAKDILWEIETRLFSSAKLFA